MVGNDLVLPIHDPAHSLGLLLLVVMVLDVHTSVVLIRPKLVLVELLGERLLSKVLVLAVRLVEQRPVVVALIFMEAVLLLPVDEVVNSPLAA